MITIKNGDILEATEPIIAHQVNCFGVAGGLAHDIFDAFPEAYNEYMKWVETDQKGSLLGKVQLVKCNNGKTIANIFGQKYPGADCRYTALECGLIGLSLCAEAKNAAVAIPYKLSCGIAGGDWEHVFNIIEYAMQHTEVVIYKKGE